MSEKREEKGDRSKPRLSIHYGEKKKQWIQYIDKKEKEKKLHRSATLQAILTAQRRSIPSSGLDV